jgi:hypothetical protein
MISSENGCTLKEQSEGTSYSIKQTHKSRSYHYKKQKRREKKKKEKERERQREYS